MKVDSLFAGTIESGANTSDEDDCFKRVEETEAGPPIEQTEPKIGSIMIIFNTWNAMIGVGTVTVPWAYQQSGIVNGIIITAISCVFTFVTNVIYLKTAGTDDNYSVTMQKYFTHGWSISMLCFIVNFYVGIILFF